MQAYVIVPPQARLCSIAPVPLSPATVTASRKLCLASCTVWRCRAEELEAHLSGCLDLNQNFCRSATVSHAKPTKNAAPAAYPSGPKALAGASVCTLPVAVSSGWQKTRSTWTLRECRTDTGHNVYIVEVVRGEKHWCLPVLLSQAGGQSSPTGSEQSRSQPASEGTCATLQCLKAHPSSSSPRTLECRTCRSPIIVSFGKVQRAPQRQAGMPRDS
jgi:hypothetical protein